MTECQLTRMQSVAAKVDRPKRTGSVDVARLTDERVATKSRLDPDLVAASRLQAHFDQRRVVERLDDLVAAERLLSTRIAWMGRLLDKSLFIPHEIVVPRSRRR